MPTIRFQVPNRFIKGNPNDPANYENGEAGRAALETLLRQPGVYVWGIKNQYGKFCLLYVGIRNDILRRINEHYNGNAFMGTSTGVLFDLKNLYNNPVPIDFYNRVMFQFNQLWINGGGNEVQRKFGLYAALLNDIVYFQCSSFMNYYCNIPTQLAIWNNFNHTGANNEYLINIPARFPDPAYAGILASATNLSERMIATKNIIRDNFYFIYAPFNGPDGIIQSLLYEPDHPLYGDATAYYVNPVYIPSGQEIARRVEIATKKALEKINLFTYGKAGEPILDFDIDLSAIQNNLVNVGGYVYPFGYGTPGDPDLIIPVPNFPPHY